MIEPALATDADVLALRLPADGELVALSPAYVDKTQANAAGLALLKRETQKRRRSPTVFQRKAKAITGEITMICNAIC